MENPTDYNQRAAKGQALNLAVHDAISKQKQNDEQYILSQYIAYYALSTYVQKHTVDEILQSLDK